MVWKMIVLASGTGVTLGMIFAVDGAAVVIGGGATIGLMITIASVVLRSLHIDESDAEEHGESPASGHQVF